jgi:alpha-tubulin suppressor-like RCC1 family protein
MGGSVSVILKSSEATSSSGASLTSEQLLISTSQAIEAETDHESGDVDAREWLGRLYLNRAKSLFDMGMYEACLDDGRSAVSCAPRDPLAYFMCAHSLLALNRLSEAKQYIDRSLLLCDEAATSVDYSEDGISYAEEYREIINECNRKIESRIQDEQSKESATTSDNRHLTPTLYAWGFGDNGQLGLGSTTNKMTASIVNALRGKTVVDIACGAMHTCAVVGDGEVYAWGDNSRGQLGFATAADSTTGASNSLVPKLIPSFIGIRVTAISAGAGHTVALTDVGAVYGWGMCASGQLGPIPYSRSSPGFDSGLDGGLDSDSSKSIHVFATPRLLSCMQGKTVVSVACGLAHTVFLLDDGSIECCGLNKYGQLGILSETTKVFVPTRPQLPASVAAISHVACGGAHTIVVDTDGCVFSCGSNSCGQLGIGSLTDQEVFTPVSVFSGTGSGDGIGAYAACGEEYSVVITRSRAVYGFGLNICGQLCVPNISSSSTSTSPSGKSSTKIDAPIRITDLDGKQIEGVVCSQGQVFAVSASGEVWTWGLPLDRANLLALTTNASNSSSKSNSGGSGDDGIIIRKPEKVTEFGRTRRVQLLCCGRKHILCAVLAAQGNHSTIAVKGLKKRASEDDDEDTDGEGKGDGANETIEVVAGQRKLLILQSRDSNHEVCTQGGALVVGMIEHADPITASAQNQLVRRRMERLNNKLKPEIIEQAVNPKILAGEHIDDNMDGTYNITLKLYVVGNYRISTRLNGLEVQGSPMNVSVIAGSVCAANCTVWWGRYAIAAPSSSSCSSSSRASAAGVDTVELASTTGTAMSFTVSLRDTYGNKVVDTSSCTITVEIRSHPDISTTENSTVYDTGSFTRGSSGIIPCFCTAPPMPGTYAVHVYVNKSAIGGNNNMVDGSPFTLNTSAPPVPISTAEGGVKAESIGEEAAVADDSVVGNAEEKAVEEEEQAVIPLSEELLALRRQEMTRRRADEALRKEQARLAFERDEKRRQKARARRTGGGFIIQYSKDV